MKIIPTKLDNTTANFLDVYSKRFPIFVDILWERFNIGLYKSCLKYISVGNQDEDDLFFDESFNDAKEKMKLMFLEVKTTEKDEDFELFLECCRVVFKNYLKV